jgi:hypothetical protein
LNQTLLSLTRGEMPRDTFSHHPAKLLALIDQAEKKGG